MSIKKKATKMQMINDATKSTIDGGNDCGNDCDSTKIFLLISEVNFEDLKFLST